MQQTSATTATPRVPYRARAGGVAGDVRDIDWEGPDDNEDSLRAYLKTFVDGDIDECALTELGFRLRHFVAVRNFALPGDIEDLARRVMDRCDCKQTGPGAYLTYATLSVNAQRSYRWEAAAGYAERAVAWAEISGDRFNIARAKKTLGICFGEAGRVADAVQVTSAAIEGAPTTVQVELLNNVGCFLGSAGLFREALEFAARAEVLHERSGDQRLVVRALIWSNLADFNWKIGNTRRALAYATKAVDFHARGGPFNDQNERIFCWHALLNLAWIYLETGQLTEARKVLARCEEKVGDTSASGVALGRDAHLRLLVAKGLLNVQVGEISTGLEMIRVGLKAEKEARRSSQMLEFLLVASRACALSGRACESNAYASQARWVAVELQRQLNPETSDEKALRQLGAKHLANATVPTKASMKRRMIDLAVIASLGMYPDGLHLFRVARVCELVAVELGWRSEEVELARMAGLLYDVGMIGVSASHDSSDESVTRVHVHLGDEMLKRLGGDFAVVCEAAKRHHEAWDGTGYPDGLVAAQIPPIARVVAVADAFEALLRSTDVDRERAWAICLAKIQERAGLQFDPEVVDALSRCLPKLPQSEEEELSFVEECVGESDVVALKRRVAVAIARLDAAES